MRVTTVSSRQNTLMDQCRKPTGWVGRFNLWSMNRHHSKLTDWGLKQISIPNDGTILDVGCGGGRTIHKLSRIARAGKIYGMDHSEESVAVSRRTNRQGIEMGRVEIRHGSVSQLPFSDNKFDLVTAVETHFFWPNLPGDMSEIFRIVKPGGTLMIVAEIYKGAGTKAAKLVEKHLPLTGMTLLSVAEHRELFERTGYSDAQVIEERDKGWICCIGRKPVAKSR